MNINFPSETRLKEIAEELGKTVVIRDGEDSRTVELPWDESKELASVLYGTLLQLRNAKDAHEAHLICSTAEYIVQVDAEEIVNTYQTVFVPLMAQWKSWVEE